MTVLHEAKIVNVRTAIVINLVALQQIFWILVELFTPG